MDRKNSTCDTNSCSNFTKRQRESSTTHINKIVLEEDDDELLLYFNKNLKFNSKQSSQKNKKIFDEKKAGNQASADSLKQSLFSSGQTQVVNQQNGTLEVENEKYKKCYSDVAVKFREKKNKRKKQILRQSKLTIAKPLYKKTSKRYEEYTDELTENLSFQYEEDVYNEFTPTCGQEYLLNSEAVASYCETNPDELASYFEQMLYIPKPMSLMAELMYA